MTAKDGYIDSMFLALPPPSSATTLDPLLRPCFSMGLSLSMTAPTILVEFSSECQSHCYSPNIGQHVTCIGGSRGLQRRPRGQNSFIFMQFSAKNLQINLTLGVGTPSPPQENPGSATVPPRCDDEV